MPLGVAGTPQPVIAEDNRTQPVTTGASGGGQFGGGLGDTPVETGEQVTGTWTYEPPDTTFDPNAWMDSLAQQLGNEMVNAAITAGYDPQAAANLFQRNWDDMIAGVQDTLFGSTWGHAAGVNPAQLESWYLTTPEGWNRIVEYGRSFYGKLDSTLTPFLGASSGGGGGGGGTRALTADEIRNQFDVDQLSARANTIKKGLVLEDFKDPRGIARAYIDAVIAGKGVQKIDFDTFVEERVKETGRFKSIFRNLPEGLDPRQYIAPLYQQALAADPNEAEARTVGAAQFGASAAQFQERLNKTDAVTGSSPFISKMQGRLSQLKGVLRG